MEVSRRFTAELKNLAAIRQFVEQQAEALQTNPDVIPDVVQAVDESATNIILHGYRGGPGNIEVEVEQAGADLVIRLRDRAPTFDPTQLPPPDLTLPLETRPIGGLGVYLTRQMVDEISHRALPQGGNELTLVKKTVRRIKHKEKTHERDD